MHVNRWYSSCHRCSKCHYQPGSCAAHVKCQLLMSSVVWQLCWMFCSLAWSVTAVHRTWWTCGYHSQQFQVTIPLLVICSWWCHYPNNRNCSLWSLTVYPSLNFKYKPVCHWQSVILYWLWWCSVCPASPWYERCRPADGLQGNRGVQVDVRVARMARLHNRDRSSTSRRVSATQQALQLLSAWSPGLWRADWKSLMTGCSARQWTILFIHSTHYSHRSPQHRNTITSENAHTTDNCQHTVDTYLIETLWHEYYINILTEHTIVCHC